MTKETLKSKLIELVRSTFIGFILSVIVMYLKPELQTSILGCYGILAGKRAFEIHATNKGSKKDVTDDSK
jgi:hypothetical protein